MASIKGGLMKQKQEEVAARKVSSGLSELMKNPGLQKRFESMLGKKSAGFLSSLLSLVNNNAHLKSAEPHSILAAAATAASLDLPVNPSLGKAWIVPYRNGESVLAQFQIGYKGIIDLAQRSGRMKSIVMTHVYEGEIKNWNRFAETYEPGERTSDNIVGYFASFELVNGFRKAAYWSREDVIAHAKKFSKSYNHKSSAWQSDFDAMACKTVLLSIMKTYAPLSIEMQMALDADNGVKSLDLDGEVIDVTLDAFDDDGLGNGELTETPTAEEPPTA